MADPELAVHLAGYRKKFSARAPNLAGKKSDDELRQFTDADGLRDMTLPPAIEVLPGEPPLSRGNGKFKYLWVITPSAVPLILEDGEAGRATVRGYAAHTNLTGGSDAHSGGELWFRDDRSFWISGGSGRYGPRSAEEMNAVVESFRAAGYAVASFGWSEETHTPQRFLRGEAQWA
jgi:hypothetical protein